VTNVSLEKQAEDDFADVEHTVGQLQTHELGDPPPDR